MTLKLSRNSACPCGSGRKYKRCCLAADEAVPTFEFTVVGPDLAGNVVADRMATYKAAMFEHWLDDPRPDFDGLSARQAAHESRFRPVLLGEIEVMEKAEATIVAPESRTDLSFLREALGFAGASVSSGSVS